MKPLLCSVVALNLLLLIHAHPENIEEVKELAQSKDPVVEADESDPQARVERCTTCAGTLKLNIKSPKEALAAIRALPGAEVHSQQSFEGCSSEKGCAGLKVKDGRVIEKFGNLDAFRAAAAADTANEFSFQAAGALGNNVFEGGLPGNGPFWWMKQDSPFKAGAGASGSYEKVSKSSSSTYTTGAGAGTSGAGAGFGANAALDLAANPFLNGDFSKLAAGAGFTGAGIDASVKPGSSYQASSFESSFSSSNKGDIDITKNPFLNGGVNLGGGIGQTAQGAGAQTGFGSSFEAAQSSFAANSGSKFGTGYTGSSPTPFATGSNVNLIQSAQKTNEFDFEQQQTQQNIDEAFASTGNVLANVGNVPTLSGGGLQQTCAGQGYVCVPKAQCNNGVVNTNGAGVLQANTKKQYCNVRTEICCRLEVSIAGSGIQGSLGVGSGTFQGSATQGSSLFATQGQSQSSFGAQGSTFGAGQSNFGVGSTLGTQGVTQAGQTNLGASVNRQTGFGVTSSDRQSGFGSTYNANRAQGSIGTGSSFGSAGSVNRGVTSSFETSRGSSYNSNKFGSTNAFGSTIAPTTPGRFGTGQSNLIETDSFSAGSETAGVYRPGATVLKPGIPYLPPDNTNSGTNVVSTAFPTIITTPRPFTTPRPYTTPKPTYLPPVTSTQAPAYLPPIGEQTVNRETRLPPGPNYIDGQLILDENRLPRPKPTPVPAPNEIPAGCAAALKCTPIEFCTAEGVISNTTVILSRDQDAYRVPLTDCRDLVTGRIGKCCRDPLYTDPWPVNQLGQWVPGVFGGNDGKYVPDSRGSSNNVRPGVTVRPPVTGSVIRDNFRTNPTTAKPTIPFGANQVTPGYPTTLTQGVKQTTIRDQGSYGQGSQGSVSQFGQGSFSQGGQGQYTGQGQIGVGTGVTGTQLASGSSYNTAYQKNQGSYVSQGQGSLVSQGQGALVNQGLGSLVSQGQGTLVNRGQGSLVSQGQGAFVSQGQGTLVNRGQGSLVTQGQGSLVNQGQGSLVSQGQYEATAQAQINRGAGVIQGQRGQEQIGQGLGVSQGFGTGIRQNQGSLVTSGQGFRGEGQLVSQGTGQLVSQGTGQLVSQGQGQLVSQGAGQVVTQGQGSYVSRGQGQIVSQGGGAFTQGGGALVSQGGGLVSQGGGGLISQGGGALVSQGGGGLVSQGGGALISQGGGGLVTQGGGALVSRGQGQFGQGFGVTTGQGQAVFQGQGSLIGQGFGAGIKQGQGIAVSQGSGFGVENEYGESVQRVFLSRYGGSGQCGVLNGQKPYGNRNDNEVDFAEIPWQAMVLLQTNRSLLCGGVITRPDVVITSAACVEGLEAKNVLIKGGEWKLGIDEEPLPFQIVQVKHILRHPFYKKGSLLYDAAILVLTENLRFAKNIYPICLPKAGETLDAYYNGAGECIVTGWGKQVLQAHLLGSIMHSINVSLINPGECQAKLSQDYPHLLEQYDEDSCACGQPTNPLNNICRVDIGSALACTTGDGQFVMRGVYSWDSGCQTGNQIAAFYKFDLEWYEWAIGLIETTRFTIKGSKVISSNSYSGQFNAGLTQGTKGVKGSGSGSSLTSGSYSGGSSITGGSVTKYTTGTGVSGSGGFNSGIKTGQVTGSITTGSSGGNIGSGVKGFGQGGVKGQFGFGQGQSQSQFSSGQLNQFSGKFSQNSQSGFGQDFASQIKAPITNSFSASYTEKKVFQTEPKIITYTTKPEIVTFTTKPEVFTYTTKPEYFTYTTKPKIVTYTTKPQIVTFTTPPKYITYETSGSGTNPQYVAPGVTFGGFSNIVGKNTHTHGANCKCNEGKK